MVVGARQLVDQQGVDPSVYPALNALGYAEAAQHVYGMKYDDWKGRYQKKATAEQMKLFQESTALQAKHDKELLKTRTTTEPVPLASNVCCQNEEQVAANMRKNGGEKSPRTVPSYTPPPLPSNLPSTLRIAVLTVSDRAFKNEYETGDLSGPAVARAVQQNLGSKSGSTTVNTTSAIVPDEAEAIQKQLQSWAKEKWHIIFTTGGTGFAPRDVTPEATRAILTQECAGLVSFCTAECSRQQPLAALSRGTAGYCGTTMIANLPGNPKAVGEIMPILLPLLLHAVVDLQSEQ